MSSRTKSIYIGALRSANSTLQDSYKHLLEMLEDAIQGWLEVASERITLQNKDG